MHVLAVQELDINLHQRYSFVHFYNLNELNLQFRVQKLSKIE